MDRRTFLQTATGIGLSAGVAGCLGDSTASGGGHDVGMTTVRFRPANIEVQPGTTVVWKNTSSHAHTVTAYEDRIPEDADFFASGGFDTQSDAESGWMDGAGGALYSEDTYEHEFTVPGTYTYYCIPHEPSGMVGTVVVSEDA